MLLRTATAIPLTLLLLSGCATGDRYNAIATTCQTYAVALNTAASLNRAGLISPENHVRIDATIPAATAVCTGPAPTDDPAAVAKISAAVVAILNAQGGAR